MPLPPPGRPLALPTSASPYKNRSLQALKALADVTTKRTCRKDVSVTAAELLDRADALWAERHLLDVQLGDRALWQAGAFRDQPVLDPGGVEDRPDVETVDAGAIVGAMRGNADLVNAAGAVKDVKRDRIRNLATRSRTVDRREHERRVRVAWPLSENASNRFLFLHHDDLDVQPQGQRWRRRPDRCCPR